MIDGYISPDADRSSDCGELFEALSMAQSQIFGARKDTSNTFFKSKYADLASCLDAVREPFAKNGLCVTQIASASADGAVTVKTVLGHKSGQWISGSLTITPDKPGPQPMGSCITYARRYALASISGLAQVDDDAESATVRDDPVWAEAEKVKDDGAEALEAWFNALPTKKRSILTEQGARWNAIKRASKNA